MSNTNYFYKNKHPDRCMYCSHYSGCNILNPVFDCFVLNPSFCIPYPIVEYLVSSDYSWDLICKENLRSMKTEFDNRLIDFLDEWRLNLYGC